MNRIRDTIRRFQASPQFLPVGTYHFQTSPDAPQQYRLHLRLEPDGRGILIINASTILHLNQTAAEYAYHMVHGAPEREAGIQIASRYHVRPDQAEQDYRDFKEKVLTLIQTPDLDPATFLDFERQDPYSAPLSAPLRLDCALTYQTITPADPRVAPTDRVVRELSTQEWQAILQKSWDAGIPHIVFTGGEPTLRTDLSGLVGYAEQLGQVTGLLSDGLRLNEPAYLQALLQSGLDHLMLILQPDDPASWQALEAVLAGDLFTTVHLTLTAKDQERLPALLQKLAEMKVTSLSLSADDPALAGLLQDARQQAAYLNLSLAWDLPVPYSALHPVALEVGEQASSGAGKAWLYVEPDGDVLPEQGINRVLGNFLNDPWDQIRQNMG
ncbi:MAG TPA: radical SAM protein [Anaerolineaceae bacterium]|nr:radical SAM protein [Anaerolineaceae bacterium]